MKLAYIMDCQGGCMAVVAADCIDHDCRNCPFNAKTRKVTRRGFVWYCIRETVMWQIRKLVCRIKGHDFVDTSYATPDTGAMGMECQRCGFGGTTILY